MYSYHIFYFPFKWEVKGRENLLFSDQVDLSAIPIKDIVTSRWRRNPGSVDENEKDELYNEKNYFYQFTHPILYDDGTPESIVYHYEYEDTKIGEVNYKIKVKDIDVYSLKVDAINLNLYATGVGILNFYLKNNKYADKDDILRINQFGRRIFPPFIGDLEMRGQIAEYIQLEGLSSNRQYKEDFSGYNNTKPWKPASFIEGLISELSSDLIVEPVIDDRMFVNCTYSCSELGQSIEKSEKEFEEFYLQDGYWYKYLFVDNKWLTCQNKVMRENLLKKQTYTRWQQYGSLYGFSRYSLVLLMGEIKPDNCFLPVHMRTIYSRMTEIALIVRATILKFSSETTKLSKLAKEGEDKQLIKRINSLYKEYIRFVNQFYFREITAQEQGIELYQLMLETLKLNDYIKDLDAEIEELHSYVNLLEERKRSSNGETLNLLAAGFLPATVITGVFGMNYVEQHIIPKFWGQLSIVVVFVIIFFLFIKIYIKRGNKS